MHLQPIALKYFFPLSPTVSLRRFAMKLYISSDTNCILEGTRDLGFTVKVRNNVITNKSILNKV